MKLSKAVSLKILSICEEKNISVNKLASICCLTQSTVQNLIAGKSKNPKMLTIIRICEGLEIPLQEFFDDELFRSIEREDWMKIVNEKEIILEENDEIIVSTMKGNKRKIKITYNNGALEIDDVSIEKIDLINEEENAIKAMLEYKKSKNKNCEKM